MTAHPLRRNWCGRNRMHVMMYALNITKAVATDPNFFFSLAVLVSTLYDLTRVGVDSSGFPSVTARPAFVA